MPTSGCGRSRRGSSHELVDWCDVFIFQGYVLHDNPSLGTSDKVVVADIYDPMHLEQLEQARELGRDRQRQMVLSSTSVLNDQLAPRRLLHVRERQAARLLARTARRHGSDQPARRTTTTRRSTIAPRRRAVRRERRRRRATPARRSKGVVPGIGPNDKVLLWGGGIYNWFDPLTLLRAVDKLRARVPDVRLYFLGLKHPNPHVPEMRMAVDTRALADELGLTGTHVFFNEGWVEYADRQNYLLEADIGVSTHFDHVETAVLVPHPHPRLLLGVVARGHHRRRRARGPRPPVRCRDRGAGRRRRRARSRPLCTAVRRGPPAGMPDGVAEARERVPLVSCARAAARVLPESPPRTRSRRPPDGGALEYRRTADGACGAALARVCRGREWSTSDAASTALLARKAYSRARVRCRPPAPAGRVRRV